MNAKVSCRNSWRVDTTFMSGTPFLTFQRRSHCHWRKRKLIHPLVWKESMDPENLFQKLNIQKTPRLQMKLKKLLHHCLWKFLWHQIALKMCNGSRRCSPSPSLLQRLHSFPAILRMLCQVPCQQLQSLARCLARGRARGSAWNARPFRATIQSCRAAAQKADQFGRDAGRPWPPWPRDVVTTFGANARARRGTKMAPCTTSNASTDVGRTSITGGALTGTVNAQLWWNFYAHL